MFKTLTRTLKLGLTALAILTAGAGVAFAQPAGFDTAIDPIAACSSDGFRKPRYCTAPVLSCIANPFGTNCATTLGTKAHTVAKVRYCGDQTVPSDEDAVSRHPCSDTWGGANAANWAKQKPDARTSPIARQNQFLKGTADGVDNGNFNIRRGSGNHRGALYFDTATFDGKALGGDATDGVAFFIDEPGYFYTGILSGTDLGAPIMRTSGTASWVGRFQSLYYETSTDFVLEVTFGGSGNKAGSIEAFVHRQSSDPFYNVASHFYLEGDFYDSGLITGTVDAGNFTGNDRKSPTGTRYPGTLTGLIGQEGAVGAFHSTGGRYGGGFVAQPLAEDDTFFDDTCLGDPFTNKHQEFCNLEFANERVTIINDCIIGSNASNAAKCGTAIAAHSCISNPFASNCKDDFADYYETARTNRINFCINNPTNSFCTNSDTLAGVCTYAPFSSACFNGDTYKSARAGKIDFCHTNPTDLSCTGVTASPNAVAWEDSFSTALPDVPDTTNRRNQFLKGTASGINRGDVVHPQGNWISGSLNLNTAEFNGEDLGGDAADGVAFALGRVNNQSTWYFYSGIFSGTDLGAPVTQTSGTASWVGRISERNSTINKEFVLEVNFSNQTVDAFVQLGSRTHHFYLDGSYDAHGLITGTVDSRTFRNSDRDDGSIRTPNGILTGLIGQEGAVGAFYGDYINSSGYAGGFVARPANDADKRYLNTTCTDDPFGYLCYLEKDKQRAKIIECTEGSNASRTGCARAVQLNPCINNPFASNCVRDFTEHYVAARTKRTEFCVGDLTNSLCTGTGAKDAICTYAPFASICFDNNDYDTARTTKYTSCHADPSIPSCTGVTASPNAIAWADSFSTALTDAPRTPSRRNQFLKGTASGVNKGDIAIPSSSYEGSLNLSTATFNGRALGGDAADGVAFFYGRDNNRGGYFSYSGIFSGTDLGAPLTQRSGTANWIGRFQAVNSFVNTDFILEIDFNGTGDKAGYIKAFVQRYKTRHFYLDGSYDARGVITGTVDHGSFTNKDRDNPTGTRYTGTLTGLIGKDGAVGAFIGGYAGGFVARPPTNAQMNYVATTCTNDPFHHLCQVEYKDQRNVRVTDCITDYNNFNTTCRGAVTHNPCIGNPFARNCADDFADHYVTAQTNIINFCTNNPTNSLCTNRDTLAGICAYAPFVSICFNGDTYNTTRARKINFCHTNTTDLSCSGVTDNPNAVAWVNSFTTALADTPDTANRRNQFLKGTASGVNKGDLPVHESGSLNLRTATFNGRTLRGDAADGVAFFSSLDEGNSPRFKFYAGIFSGTDLGAPLTQRSGTASWVGQFQSLHNPVTKDFVLEVTFGGSGDKAGSIEAFVQRTDSTRFYHINGTFDNNGLIEGTTDFANFINNDRDRHSRAPNEYNLGVLTGLIGQEGAVGAFHSNAGNELWYAGGFVARPANSTDRRYLNTTCNEDPFGPLCYLEKGKQRTKIIECTEGSNAGTTGCTRAVQLNPCINNPFASNCVTDFAEHYETARTNRAEFCVGDLTNSLCTNSDTIAGICAFAPFASVCFNGDTYKTTRAGKIDFCHANTTDLSCTGVTDNPNAVAWEYRLKNRDDDPITLTDAPDTANPRSQFLKGTASGVNKGDIVIPDGSYEDSLNLNAATFNGRALGGDVADGVAFFLGRVNNQGTYYHYSGIFSGTDLGAPVTQRSGTASWVGRFQTASWNTDKEFVLEIDFNGTGDKAGFIKAFVQQGQGSAGSRHFYLNGSYDAHGLITGTADLGDFANNDRGGSTRTPNGTLTGLIGKEGAVGAFISNYNSNNNYAGGFVARPAKVADNSYLDTTCTEDPFGYLCYLETDKQRAKIIECTEGSNASGADCTRAVQLNPCINNPFASNCADDFTEHYEAARTNRTEFCVGNLTNGLCTGTDAISAICAFAPFASVCFNGDTYKTTRAGKIGFCHTNTTHLSCTGVTDNPNAVAWEDSLANRDDDPIILTDAPDTTNRRNQFLKGTASGVNRGDIIVPNSYHDASLDLNTAMFNGVALGGDVADGMTAIVGRVNNTGTWYWHAGIFSGTDLGAPVTDLSGTASWVGRFKAPGWGTDTEFVLEIDFDGTGDKSGYIKAFVQQSGNRHLYLDGSYDAHGVIAGTVDSGNFTNNYRDDSPSSRRPGTLTGLIGKEGAVGAFISNQAGTGQYTGGFVARPANNADKVYLDRICDEDPFGYLCYLEKDKQRTKIIECIQGSNASGASCTRAVQLNPCINNPFASNCEDDFTEHYETARTNRINFCINNPTNSFCTNSSAISAICTYAPFVSICFNGTTYKSTRADKIGFCHINTSDLSCTGVTDNPNAVAWEDSLANRDDDPIILTDAPDTTNRRNQFLKGTTSGVNRGDIVVPSSSSYHGALNLNTATFRGVPLEGDAADGVAFFRGRVNGRGTYYHYSGIFSGTDLGAPITDLSGTASWVGRFQSLYHSVNKDFILEVDYTNKTLDAFVQYSDNLHFYLDGDYDDKGIITGDFNLSRFNNKNRESKISTYRTGVITGLIGQEGAVGAFHGDAAYSFAGGFVARPANTADNSHLDTICTNDPFGYLCYLETDKQRDKIIECTEGSNAGTTDCTRAVQLNPCINNPFASNCVSDFADHYLTARTNRINFCVGNLTNSLCTGTDAISGICNYAPFLSICFNGTTYKSARAGKIGFCHTNTTHLSCTGVTDNPNAVAWVKSFTTALSSAPSTTNRRNQFLKGTTRGINRGDIVLAGSWANETLNMSTATFLGTPLGGDASDGIAAIAGRVNNTGTYYWYAGIFSGTDLGAPVRQRSEKASWVGRFQEINYNIEKDFVLEIDFSSRTVDAFVEHGVGKQFFHIDGRYNSKGIITGTVKFGNFEYKDRLNPIDANNHVAGALTGLIGTEGAVGAFISNQTGAGYAGGFVARPPKSGERSSLTTTCDDDSEHPFCYLTVANRFLPGGRGGLIPGGFAIGTPRLITVLTLGDNFKSGEPLGGSSANGVSFFNGRVGSKELYFAGILSGTDLGRNFSSANVAMEWNGRIKAIGNAIDKDFKLKITFNGSSSHVGEVEAFVQRTGSQHYYIKGKFDSSGVITGTVDLGNFNGGNKGSPTGDRLPGKLRGAIGEHGAIGAFIAKNNGNIGYYAGGFVATPPPPIRYAVYRSDIDPSVTTYPRGHGIIRSHYVNTVPDFPPSRIVIQLNRDATRNYVAAEFVNLNLSIPFAGKRGTGDSNDGVYFFRGSPCSYGGRYIPGGSSTCTPTTTTESFFAGVNPNTNLGPVLDKTDGSADWRGKLLSYYTTDGVVIRDFNLNVNYRTKRISARVAFPYNHSALTYHIDGNYDNYGVIHGSVNIVGAVTPNTGLIGLIGQEGAVGAFVSTHSPDSVLDFAGGFVAQAPAR